MSRKIIYLAALLIVIMACSHPLRNRSASTSVPPQNPLSAGTGSTDETISSGGVTRHYILHVPSTYQQGSAVALIINFHGFDSNSQQEENLTGMSAKADSEGFIVVYPDGMNNEWHDGSGTEGDADKQFIRDLIAALVSQYSINPKQIYATGFSNGGGMTNRLGCDMADAIAAIAPNSGAYNFWQDCHPSRPVPVLAFHGLNDHIVPYDGGTPQSMEPPIEAWAANWATLDECDSTPALTTPADAVAVHTWSGCKDHVDVLLYTLANHGHSWPGSAIMPKTITSQTVNATDLMWDFFKAHPMP